MVPRMLERSTVVRPTRSETRPPMIPPIAAKRLNTARLGPMCAA
jgi:hypothetical protein